MVTPINPVRPEGAGRDVRVGAKLSCRITSSTASRVSAATSGRSLSTRDTVVIETPACAAMSRIVARPFCRSPLMLISSEGLSRFRSRFRKDYRMHGRELQTRTTTGGRGRECTESGKRDLIVSGNSGTLHR
jgi:hypothetical protein